MKEKILACLLECEDFISGQELGEKFQVSRTAIWKAIRQLKDEGYEVQAVQNKGYRLLSSPDKMSAAGIRKYLREDSPCKNVVYFDEIDSTNNEAKRASAQYPDGTLFVADCQVSGRGRRGRDFQSPSGTGIFMTMLLKPAIDPAVASRLTLIAALAVQKGIEKVTGEPCGIKWPNDVILSGKKVCGILTEMSVQDGEIEYVVVGIGINVLNTEFPPEIQDVATSLWLEGRKVTERNQIIAEVWNAFFDYYEKFLQTEDLSGMMSEYNALLINNNEKVRVLDETNPFVGTAKGINQKGELLVDTGEEIVVVRSGEVSVRGVYGYV